MAFYSSFLSICSSVDQQGAARARTGPQGRGEGDGARTRTVAPGSSPSTPRQASMTSPQTSGCSCENGTRRDGSTDRNTPD